MGYPRRNTLQRDFDRKSKVQVANQKNQITVNETLTTTNLTPKTLKTEMTSEAIEFTIVKSGHQDNSLYPQKLWQLHNDIDTMFYGLHKLSEIERQELYERFPYSLSQAEKLADKLLFEFIQDKINTIGPNQYHVLLQKSMNKQTQILYALRCFIATHDITKTNDSVQIYKNSVMNSHDFYPESCKGTYVDEDGIEQTYYREGPNNKDSKNDSPYWRSENHQSTKHKLSRTLLNQKSKSSIDELPIKFRDELKQVLLDLGIAVESNDSAWNQLDSQSKQSTIDERIIARIAYLITNININKKQKQINDEII